MSGDRTNSSDVALMLGNAADGSWSSMDLLAKETNFLELGVRMGRLWVLGGTRLNSFNGREWAAHSDPDNG